MRATQVFSQLRNNQGKCGKDASNRRVGRREPVTPSPRERGGRWRLFGTLISRSEILANLAQVFKENIAPPCIFIRSSRQGKLLWNRTNVCRKSGRRNKYIQDAPALRAFGSSNSLRSANTDILIDRALYPIPPAVQGTIDGVLSLDLRILLLR